MLEYAHGTHGWDSRAGRASSYRAGSASVGDIKQLEHVLESQFRVYNSLVGKNQVTVPAFASAFACVSVPAFLISDFPGESDATFTYGGSGLRRKKVENETTKWYNYFGYNVIAEEDGTGGGIGAGGALVQTYVHDPGKAIGTIIQSSLNDTYFWYHQDHIGSTRLLTAPDRATAASYEYTPYGEPLSLSGWFWVNSYMFTGKELDYATGTYYFPYRYYSPTTVRWLTRDPLGMTDGPNLYGYVKGNPTRFTDALGLSHGEYKPCKMKKTGNAAIDKFACQDCCDKRLKKPCWNKKRVLECCYLRCEMEGGGGRDAKEYAKWCKKRFGEPPK